MESKHFYEFGCFRMDVANGQLLRGDVPVPLTRKAFDLLLILVENAGNVLSTDDLLKLAWPDTAVAPKIISVNISLLRKALGDGPGGGVYIATVPRRGYQFVAKVRELVGDHPVGPAEQLGEHREAGLDLSFSGEGPVSPKDPSALKPTRSILAGHPSHVLIGSSIYANHYAIALVLEIAFKFDTYGTEVLSFAPLFFCWIVVTSVLGLTLPLRSKFRNYGLVLGAIIFVGTAAVAFLTAWFVLPGIPITEAKFQTYAAPAAYLKDIAYILPIALFFFLVPFNFIATLEHEIEKGRHESVLGLLSGRRLSVRPGGTIYLKPWTLGAMLAGFAGYSLPARAHLFDNLLASRYLGLFEILHQTRTLLEFALGLYCLAWYYWALNRSKTMCIMIRQSLGVNSQDSHEHR